MAPKRCLALMLGVVLLGSMLVVVQGQTPGLITGVSEAGLQVIESVTVAVLNSQLAGIQLPDQSQRVLSPIGYINITITDLVITSVNIPQYSVNIIANKGFALNLPNAAVSLSFDWKWRQDLWPHDSGDGTGTGASDADITATITLGVAQQRPTAQVTAMKIDLSDFKFHLKGGIVSWFVDLFVDTFKFIIKDLVQAALNNDIPPIINGELAAALNTFPTSLPIPPYLTFYFPFYTFTATSDILSWGMEGLASTPGQPQNLSPYVPPAMPVEESPLTMSQTFISDFMFNTALFTLYSENYLDFTISQSELPPADQYLLNTNAWKDAVPALYKDYPNAPMNLTFSAGSTPYVNFSATAIASATIPGFMAVNIINAGNAFVLEGNIFVQLNISIVSNTIHVEIANVDVSFTLYSSNIGQFSTLPLRSLIKTILSIGIPVINKILAPGLPIPSIAGLSLVNPEIVWSNNFFMVGSNITYT